MPGVLNGGEAAHKVIVVGDLRDRVAAADRDPSAQVLVDLDEANDLTIEVAVEIAVRLALGDVSFHGSWNDGPRGGNAGTPKLAAGVFAVQERDMFQEGARSSQVSRFQVSRFTL
jgi:hypothetical protein